MEIRSISRWYQEDAVNSVLLGWEWNDRVILHSPTGSGKNFMAAKMIEQLAPARCLFLGDQDELVHQPAEAIARFAGIIPAIEKAKLKASFKAKVVVGSVQTLAKKNRLERFPEDFFQFIIADEAHRGCDQKAKIFDYFKGAKVCGLTATPFRANLKDLSKWYEDVAFSFPMLDLIDEGFAPPLKVMTVPLEIDLADVQTKRGFDGRDYDAESLSTTIAPYYEEIVRLLKEKAPGRNAIVFLPLIKSSEAFADIARKAGISAVHVDGKSENRDEILEGFRRGSFQMLCNSQLVSTGVDIPRADCLVNLRPTRSAVLYQQQVGRVLRVLPGVIDDLPGKSQARERRARIAASQKPDALIIDLLWQHADLGVMRPEHLIAGSAEDAEEIGKRVKKQRTEADLQWIARMVQSDREAAIVKRLEKNAYRQGGTTEPKELGFILGDRSLMEYEPVSRWELDKPSEKQLSTLLRFGIDIKAVDTKGLASRLLDKLIGRAQIKLATIGQLRALHHYGIEADPKKMEFAEASKLIAAAKISRAKIVSVSA